MANVITTLLKLDGTQFKTGMKAAQASIKETDGVVGKAKAGWSAAFAGFASSPVAIGAATAAVGAFAASSVRAASDLEESVNAVNVTFGKSADKILESGESAAKSVGLANSEFNQLATPLGSILKNAGFDLDTVADKTIILTQRAADMASVFNTDVSDALGAIQAGLRGEQDPLERFGVGLSAAKVEARALADSGKENAKQLTDQEKQLARVNIILDQTNQTAGDYAKTSDSLANQTRRLQAEFKDLQATAGKELIPILSDLAGALIDVRDAGGEAKSAIESIPGGKGLLDALGTNLFELPGKAKGEWDDLGRAIGVLPPKEREARVENDRYTDSVLSLGSVAAETAAKLAETADEAADLGDKAANAGPKIGDMAGALDDAEQHLADLNQQARDNALDTLAAAIAGVGDALDESFGSLEDDLGSLDLFDDITEQFDKIAEAAKNATDPQGVRDLNREVRRLQGQLLDYLRTVDDIPPDKVTEIIAQIRTGDIDVLKATLDELTKDRFINIGIATKGIPLFQSANAVFTPGAAPSAPTFNGQSAIPSAPMIDQRQITYNFPVGTTVTSQYQNDQINQRRNGSR